MSVAAAEGGSPGALSLLEVLQAAADHGLDVNVGQAERERAEAAVRSARAAFDPSYVAGVQVVPSTRTRGYAGGFLADLQTEGWSIQQEVSGTTASGTAYALGFGWSRSSQTTTLDLAGVRTVELYDAFRSNVYASVSQELLRGFRLSYNLQNVTRAQNALSEAQIAVDATVQDTLLAAARAYWSWAFAVRAEQIATDMVAVAEEALRIGELRVERGQLAPVEQTRLQAALVQARQDALDAHNAAAAAANVVLLAMGRDPGPEVVPATPSGDVPDLTIEPARAIAVARTQNLSLALARQRVASAETDLKNARHGLLPSVAATADLGVASLRCPPGTSDPTCTVGDALGAIGGLTADDNLPFYTIGGRVVAPLGNRRARGMRDDAAGVLERRQVELAALERATDAAVEEQVRALASARSRMDLADTNVRLAEETLAAEEALAAAGRVLQKDVLEARTEVARARVAAERARTDYRLAQAALLALQGQLTPTEPGS